jgi:hypothetical protein
MANEFDPYREALVIETITRWPAELRRPADAERERLEDLLHAEPRHAANLAYIRMHTGFCREITVSPEDLQRLAK